MSEPNQSSELEVATREYVERLKETYPNINERDLYELVYEIARQRVEEARREGKDDEPCRRGTSTSTNRRRRTFRTWKKSRKI